MKIPSLYVVVVFAMVFIQTLLIFPAYVEASPYITEVMYDPSGTDTDNEWVEIYNPDNSDFDLTDLTFFEEGTHHHLKAVVGTMNFVAKSYAIITNNTDQFRARWPQYQGLVLSSSFSLKNTGEAIALTLKDSTFDSLTYDPTIGAQGDGTSLQKIDQRWVAGVPTPGQATIVSGITSESIQNSDSSNLSTSTMSTGSMTTTMVVSVPTGNSNFPIAPQIFCRIIGKKIIFSGVETEFSAESWGLKNEPLEHARYVWNFGDTVVSEGKRVKHTFLQAGTYIVYLGISSGEYSSSDRFEVTVLAPDLGLSVTKEEMRVINHTIYQVDVGNLKLVNEDEKSRFDFVFPEHTLINPGHTLHLLWPFPVNQSVESITIRYLSDVVIARGQGLQEKPEVIEKKNTQTGTKSLLQNLPKKSSKKGAKIPKKTTQSSLSAKAFIMPLETSTTTWSSTTQIALSEPPIGSNWTLYGQTAVVTLFLTGVGIYVLRTKIPLGK